MNGLHDLGGMHGFGPVIPEPERPVFHAEWYKRALAMTVAMGNWGRWSIDESRHARETLPPADMVNLSYYERWTAGLVTLLLRHGFVTRDELREGRADANAARETPALTGPEVAAVLARGSPSARDLDRPPRFQPGDRVRTINAHPPTHTRLPRYARGHVGEIVLYHGPHVFADARAHRKDAPAEPLYAVRFAARELWGPGAEAGHSVTINLWEPHLEPV
ncbi:MULTISPECIES: nitrile hydratase subunit beta [Rhodomicrobium]|uniref:nitrile hydratase subunit beta n=1 Tax=Rhodomicrobium TaxID=1068 RepID=UPI000B4BFC41|nr:MULTISPECIES: nitrile hydratase subunit beta [Rhodomicrobium]